MNRLQSKCMRPTSLRYSHPTCSSFSNPSRRQLFRTSAPAFVKAGDPIPDVDLVEGSPGNKVNLARELKGKSLVIGVPAAFSPSCSMSHIPGYIKSPKLKSYDSVFVVSVNDPFVMKAWGATLDPSGSSGVRFLGDPSSAFTKALDLHFDGSSIFGGPRSKRYALTVESGKVKEAFVEPDNTGMNGKSVVFSFREGIGKNMDRKRAQEEMAQRKEWL